MGKEISYLSHEKYTFTTYTGEKLIYKWGIFFLNNSPRHMFYVRDFHLKPNTAYKIRNISL